jgi:VWFA-related protein
MRLRRLNRFFHLTAATLVVAGTAASYPATLAQEPARAEQQPAPPAPPAAPAAQAPAERAPGFGERLDVRVVNVEVWVHRKDGSPVEGLSASDFKLTVDGQEVPIANFYAQVGGRPTAPEPPAAVAEPVDRAPAANDAPVAPADRKLHTVIFVDTANLRAANRSRVFEHLRTFLRESLRPEDPVSVVSLDQSLVIHSDFLNDQRAIESILSELERTSPRAGGNDLQRRQLLSDIFEGTAMRSSEARTAPSDEFNSGPQLNFIRAYAAEEYQRGKASLGALDRFVASLGGIPGRKALIYVSEGIPNRPGEELFIAWRERYRDLRHQRITTLDAEYYREVGHFELLQDFQALARRANASSVTVYAIDAVSDHTGDLRSASLSGGVAQEALYAMEANLRDPIESTAVATGGFRIQASPRLEQDLARVAADFGTYYSLGFRPTHGADGKDHAIDVKLRRGAGVVSHRQNYRLKTSDEAMGEATMASLLYHAGENPLGVRLEAGRSQPREDGLTVLPITVQVPMRDIALVPRGDTFASQFSFYVTVKDKSGQPRPVQKIPFHLSLPAAAAELARQQDAAYDLPVVLRPGDQQVAIGVRDEIGGLSATARLDLAPVLDGSP